MKFYESAPGGGTVLSLAGMSLLFGIPRAEIEEAIRRDRTEDGWHIPEEWVRRGRRRWSEAAAATGLGDLHSVLVHWFSKEGTP